MCCNVEDSMESLEDRAGTHVQMLRAIEQDFPWKKMRRKKSEGEKEVPIKSWIEQRPLCLPR